MVMMLGLHCFEEYAASLGIELPELDADAAVTKLLEDLLESGGTSVKTGLDYFLEELSVMAVAGTLQHGRHYVYQDGRLALHFASCHAAYCEHSRRTGFEGEVPDRKAMRRQVQESHRRNGYVLETDARVCFNGRDDRRRAVAHRHRARQADARRRRLPGAGTRGRHRLSRMGAGLMSDAMQGRQAIGRFFWGFRVALPPRERLHGSESRVR